MTEIDPDIRAVPSHGERAYVAYGDSPGINWKNYRGEPMPQWDALPENIKQGWECSCKKTISDICVQYESDIDFILNIALRWLRVQQNSRAISIAITKVEEAQLWLTRR